jgi:phosphoglycerate dehydrogenase-like enzyme
MKAVLHYRATPGFRRQISALECDWLRVVVVDETDKDAFAREMNDADVLLHVLEPFRDAAFDQAPVLKLIQKLGIGVDTIDLDSARRRGIAVCNMPGTNTRAVAELALLLMLATLRRVAELDAHTRAGHGWALDARLLDDLAELGGRTVGLVGCGAVGTTLIPMLQGIGARVIFTDTIVRSQAHAAFVRFDELLASADIVSLHVPLTPETAGMMNAEAFAVMKRGAILVNTARGGLVDLDALYSALRSGRLRGAGLDVFESEPANTSHPLFTLPNVVMTPHLAWFTAETLSRSLGVFAENCRRLRDGEPLLNRVI